MLAINKDIMLLGLAALMATHAAAQQPRVDALPKPLAVTPLDLQALAQGFATSAPVLPQGVNSPALLVFVSFSMPEASLERLVDQAERSDAVLVLRGFDQGSLKGTAARVQKLIGQRKVTFQIDPQAFERFDVHAVPTFVLTAGVGASLPCAAGQCYPSDGYALVSGDVSIDYALEHIERRAPRLRAQARALRQKLGG